MRQTCLYALLILSLPVILYAQPTTGTLDGRVVGGDGFGLPGATVTISGPDFSHVTSTDGNGDYSFTELPPGNYTVTVQLEGFASSQRRGVTVGARPARADFVLQLAEIAEEILITSSSNAAINLPATLTSSQSPRGGIINVWGFNVGPEQLTSNPTVPFDKTVAGYSIYIETGGERHDAFPLFVSRNQSAAILSSKTPLGEGNLFVEGNGKTSNPFRVNIVDHQPGIFTIRQDGQGAGIFTQPDFSLITPQNPAKPGDTIIGWGTGFAPGEFDDRPGVFDKRSSLGDFNYQLGGVPIPDDSILYIGSGGAVGVDQWIGTIGEDVPFGCAVPFSIFATLPGGERLLSNTVTLPISQDGSTCGDPHGFSSDLVDRIHEGSLNLATTFVTELGLFDGGDARDLLTADLAGESVTASTFNPPIPLGTCGYGWRPEDFPDRFAPDRLVFRGNYTLTLPWATINLNENSSLGPFQELFSRPSPDLLTDGDYSFLTDGFESGGSPTSISGAGAYIRKAGRLRDAVEQELVQTYQDDGFVSISQAIDATLQAGGGETGTVLDYQLISDSGPLGTHFLRCLSSAEPAALAASRDSLIEQAWTILSTRFSGTSEDGSVTIRFGDLDTNLGPRGPGLDRGQEVFDALFNVRLAPNAPADAVTNCNEFSVCP